MEKLKIELSLDKKDNATTIIEVDGQIDIFATLLAESMIDQPELYTIFNLACKAYEHYKLSMSN